MQKQITKARRHSLYLAPARRPAHTASCIHMERILVPVDFSPESRQALRYAAAFAAQFGASLTLFHVVELLTFTVDVGYGPVNRLVPNEDMLHHAATKLKQLKKKRVDSQLKVELM